MSRSSSPGRIAQAMAQNAVRTLELGVAAQSVVAARMAMGVQAARQPRLSHLEEATRMTGEKFTPSRKPWPPPARAPPASGTRWRPPA